jgi:hypothetical protein
MYRYFFSAPIKLDLVKIGDGGFVRVEKVLYIFFLISLCKGGPYSVFEICFPVFRGQSILIRIRIIGSVVPIVSFLNQTPDSDP